MSFSINTNVASLSAQNYLRINSNFQGQTINRVTSGLRIVQSGDDAAGLAIANGYRSDQAVLTQGVRNANDGMSQLQIVDGGMSNISQLLDRARTLATQSATGTFTGDRSVLNNEFQSVLGEIDRQAQAIGLDTGGIFAKSLSVFIGGGKSNGAINAVQNGSVSVDLSRSTVDSKSLGLEGVRSIGTAGTDIGPNSATSVAQILSNVANTASEATSGYTTFSISGPGFTGANKINVAVNLSGVTDANTLVTNINNAIQAAGAGSTQYATAFKNAQITASLNTDSTGKTQLTFSSSSAAFQVQAGDQVANAFLGNYSSGSTGAALNTMLTGFANVANPTLQNIVGTALGNSTVIGGTNNALNLTVGGTTSTATITSGTYTQFQLLTQVNAAISASGLNTHVTASLNSSNQLVFTAAAPAEAVTVNNVANDAAGALGLTDTQTSITTPTLTTNDTVTLQFAGGGLDSPVSLSLNQFTAGTTTVANVLSGLNSAVTGNAKLSAAGIKVTTSTAGNALVFTNSAGQRLTVNATGDSANVLGLGQFIGTPAHAYDYVNLTAGIAYSASANPTTGTSTLGISIDGGANQVISADLTAGTATAGTVIGNASILPSVAITAGHTVKILVDNVLKTVTLTGGAPELAATILSDFNTGLGASASVTVDTSGFLHIASATKGTASSIQIVAGGSVTAGELTSLGLPAVGTAASVGQNASETDVMQQLNSAIASNTTLTQAGLKAVDSSGSIQLQSTNGTRFRLDAYGAADIGFGKSGGAFTGNISSSAPGASPYYDAQGATVTATMNFAPILFGGDLQTISFSASDTGGTAHTTSVALSNTNAGSLDQAISTINLQLQQSNDPTLQALVAVKEDTGASTLTAGTALAASTTITGSSNDRLNLTVGGVTATLSLTASSYTPAQMATQINTQIGTSNLNGLVQASVDSTNHLVLTATTPTQTVEVNYVARDAAASLGLTDGQVSANEGIKIISSLNNFNVSIGAVGNTAGTEGIGSAVQQGTVLSGATVGTGSTADISNQASAESAVTALSSSVSMLGSAQAVVGRGENQFNYAINLAQSQLTNLATAESRIRDADLAAEAANLTKAQILMQAGVAALAQANSAPQQVLTLLRG